MDRWRNDLRELFSGITRDPFVNGPGRRWDRDFAGEVDKEDHRYAAFIVLVSLIPAAVAAYLSQEPQWKMLAQLFGAPLQTVISGFLTASLIFLGSHVNKVAKPWPVAHKLMLRIMSAHPLIAFAMLSRWGAVLVLLLHGLLVVRGVRKTYPIAIQNVLLFYGIVYLVFALFQLHALISPPRPDLLQRFSHVAYASFFAA